jgi:tRNA G18 (ribose-2'-O)-methylase SpoU
VKPSQAAFAKLPRAPMSVVLDDVRSLANVGLIFRICDALRVEHLYLCGITGHPPYPSAEEDPRTREVQERALREITKTAVMAVPYVPWSYEPNVLALVARLRARSYQIVTAEQAHNSVPYTREGIYRTPVCLVFGHERAGVAPQAIAEADVCVEIPVYGMANSLNVAMSLALIGFEVHRQHAGLGLSAL